MEDQHEILFRIQEKTEKLIELCEALREQNDLLNLDNQSLKVALETSQNHAKIWKQKAQALEIAEAITMSPENKLDFHQKINKFVEEIDRCIDFINQ